jgi:hypothetical protein
MKVFGIILEIFAAMNLLVAIIASANHVNADVVMSKMAGAFLLGAIGGLLHYFGNKKMQPRKLRMHPFQTIIIMHMPKQIIQTN